MKICRSRRLTHAAVCAVLASLGGTAVRAQTQTQTQTIPATAPAAIARLGDFDQPRRTAAARALRRMPADEAAGALVDAVAHAKDEYIRFRAFVLLTGFNHPRMADIVRTAMRDRNDRLREGAYTWLQRNPDPALTDTLLRAIETEQGEFVRPALVRAVAALDATEPVRTTLAREVERGLDIFRSAVISALGNRRAAYAVDAIAATAALDGPLQDDAVAALGKIGGDKALRALGSIVTRSAGLKLRIATATCLAKGDCASQREQLLRELASPLASAAVSSLALLVSGGDRAALAALTTAARTSTEVREEAAMALASVALEDPRRTLDWLVSLPASDRDTVVLVLHDAFEALEADLDEEAFYAVIRSTYWQASEGSDVRTIAAALIDRLEF